MSGPALRRALRVGGIAALALFAAAFGLIFWITSTPSGARRAISWLGAILKGSFIRRRLRSRGMPKAQSRKS